MPSIKVKKKPLVIEAMQFTGENVDELKNWSDSQVWLHPGAKSVLVVQTLEGLLHTPIGSYVMKGIKGEVWPIREDIFKESYDIVE